MPRRYSLTVEGMHCAACAETVARALQKVAGVQYALVNFATERALVEVDDSTDLRVLTDAVKQAGYRLATHTLTFALSRPLSDEDLQGVRGIAGVLAVERGALGATPTVTIRYLDGTVSRYELRRRLQGLGYETQPLETESPRKPRQEEAKALWHRAWIGLAVSFLVMALTMSPSLAHQGWASWAAFGLTTFVLLWVGMPFFRRALAAALCRTATMDTLVSIGALSAYAYSAWSLAHWSLLHQSLSHLSSPPHLYFDSAAFILSAISLGKGLEARARALATASLRRLINLLPATATVLRDGVEQQVALEAVQVGDILLVRAGERVPVDGIVVAGKGSVDESLLTGESEPVVKDEGSEVLGGSVCVDGFLQVEALRVSEATFVAQMAQLMEEAQGTKPPMQRLADRVASIFVPIVLSLAAITFLGWLIAAGDATKALVAAVSVTVIACPCAMGLATPTAIAFALGRLARSGILVRNAEAMEKAASITTVILDKTGTITKGQMRVVALWSATNSSLATCHLLPMKVEDLLLAMAASAERGSLHPIAQAIVQAATERHLPLWELAEVRTEVGAGVAAKLVGQQDAGNERRSVEKEVFVGKLAEEDLPEGMPVAEWLNNGWTVVGVWVDGELVGGIALADALRPDAQETVQQLKRMGIKVIMATGDKPQTALKVARQLSCDDVLALATPQRKAQLVRECQERGERVLMVGDGINDAVALAQADIGVAIATGTELAALAADVLLVTDRLMALAELLEVGRQTKAIMVQNLFWAFAYNIAALPLAALGKLNPMIAATAMALSSITVVGNALRLRRPKT